MSDNSKSITHLHMESSLEHLVCEVDEYEYSPPPPHAVTTKRVRFRHLGPSKPMSIDDDFFSNLIEKES